MVQGLWNQCKARTWIVAQVVLLVQGSCNQSKAGTWIGAQVVLFPLVPG